MLKKILSEKGAGSKKLETIGLRQLFLIEVALNLELPEDVV